MAGDLVALGSREGTGGAGGFARARGDGFLRRATLLSVLGPTALGALLGLLTLRLSPTPALE